MAHGIPPIASAGRKAGLAPGWGVRAKASIAVSPAPRIRRFTPDYP